MLLEGRVEVNESKKRDRQRNLGEALLTVNNAIQCSLLGFSVWFPPRNACKELKKPGQEHAVNIYFSKGGKKDIFSKGGKKELENPNHKG